MPVPLVTVKEVSAVSWPTSEKGPKQKSENKSKQVVVTGRDKHPEEHWQSVIVSVVVVVLIDGVGSGQFPRVVGWLVVNGVGNGVGCLVDGKGVKTGLGLGVGLLIGNEEGSRDEGIGTGTSI